MSTKNEPKCGRVLVLFISLRPLTTLLSYSTLYTRLHFLWSMQDAQLKTKDGSISLETSPCSLHRLRWNGNAINWRSWLLYSIHISRRDWIRHGVDGICSSWKRSLSITHPLFTPLGKTHTAYGLCYCLQTAGSLTLTWLWVLWCNICWGLFTGKSVVKAVLRLWFTFYRHKCVVACIALIL